MKWKEFVIDYLTFSRRDRIGVITILILILAIFFLPKAISSSVKKSKTVQDTSWVAAIKPLEQKEAVKKDPAYKQYEDENSQVYQYDRTRSNYFDKPKGELFHFDPNTLPADGWEKLGLREKTIHTIQNYLSKGGHFKKPEDLQKVYGLHQDEYERLAPYVRIVPGTDNKPEYQNENIVPVAVKPTLRIQVIDINTSDTSAFISLPGIGSKLAARIVTFREKLGGFYSISQIGETYGLPDSTFQKIKQYLKLENFSIKKININTTTLDELKAHPYIRYSLANPIIAYRNEHGPFARLEDIKKVMAVTDEVYNKIVPYLIIQ